MSLIKFVNNLRCTLVEAATVHSTTIHVTSPDTLTWPTLESGDSMILTCQGVSLDKVPLWEILRVTNIVLHPGSKTATLTIERGLEGTTPQAFPAGAVLENRLTAGTLNHVANAANFDHELLMALNAVDGIHGAIQDADTLAGMSARVAVDILSHETQTQAYEDMAAMWAEQAEISNISAINAAISASISASSSHYSEINSSVHANDANESARSAHDAAIDAWRHAMQAYIWYMQIKGVVKTLDIPFALRVDSSFDLMPGVLRVISTITPGVLEFVDLNNGGQVVEDWTMLGPYAQCAIIQDNVCIGYLWVNGESSQTAVECITDPVGVTKSALWQVLADDPKYLFGVIGSLYESNEVDPSILALKYVNSGTPTYPSECDFVLDAQGRLLYVTEADIDTTTVKGYVLSGPEDFVAVWVLESGSYNIGPVGTTGPVTGAVVTALKVPTGVSAPRAGDIIYTPNGDVLLVRLPVITDIIHVKVIATTTSTYILNVEGTYVTHNSKTPVTVSKSTTGVTSLMTMVSGQFINVWNTMPTGSIIYVVRDSTPSPSIKARRAIETFVVVDSSTASEDEFHALVIPPTGTVNSVNNLLPDAEGDVNITGKEILRNRVAGIWSIDDAIQDLLDRKVEKDQGVDHKDEFLGINASGMVTPYNITPVAPTLTTAAGKYADALETAKAIKEQVDKAVKYRGTVDTEAQLPTTDNTNGDWWDIRDYNQTFHEAHAIWNADNSDWDINIDEHGNTDDITLDRTSTGAWEIKPGGVKDAQVAADADIAPSKIAGGVVNAGKVLGIDNQGVVGPTEAFPSIWWSQSRLDISDTPVPFASLNQVHGPDGITVPRLGDIVYGENGLEFYVSDVTENDEVELQVLSQAEIGRYAVRVPNDFVLDSGYVDFSYTFALGEQAPYQILYLYYPNEADQVPFENITRVPKFGIVSVIAGGSDSTAFADSKSLGYIACCIFRTTGTDQVQVQGFGVPFAVAPWTIKVTQAFSQSMIESNASQNLFVTDVVELRNDEGTPIDPPQWDTIPVGTFFDVIAGNNYPLTIGSYKLTSYNSTYSMLVGDYKPLNNRRAWTLLVTRNWTVQNEVLASDPDVLGLMFGYNPNAFVLKDFSEVSVNDTINVAVAHRDTNNSIIIDRIIGHSPYQHDTGSATVINMHLIFVDGSTFPWVNHADVYINQDGNEHWYKIADLPASYGVALRMLTFPGLTYQSGDILRTATFNIYHHCEQGNDVGKWEYTCTNDIEECPVAGRVENGILEIYYKAAGSTVRRLMYSSCELTSGPDMPTWYNPPQDIGTTLPSTAVIMTPTVVQMDQGTANSGKVLGIDADGRVVPVSTSGNLSRYLLHVKQGYRVANGREIILDQDYNVISLTEVSTNTIVTDWNTVPVGSFISVYYFDEDVPGNTGDDLTWKGSFIKTSNVDSTSMGCSVISTPDAPGAIFQFNRDYAEWTLPGVGETFTAPESVSGYISEIQVPSGGLHLPRLDDLIYDQYGSLGLVTREEDNSVMMQLKVLSTSGGDNDFPAVWELGVDDIFYDLYVSFLPVGYFQKVIAPEGVTIPRAGDIVITRMGQLCSVTSVDVVNDMDVVSLYVLTQYLQPNGFILKVEDTFNGTQGVRAFTRQYANTLPALYKISTGTLTALEVDAHDWGDVVRKGSVCYVSTGTVDNMFSDGDAKGLFLVTSSYSGTSSNAALNGVFVPTSSGNAVDSVNGKTGTVVLTAADISFSDTEVTDLGTILTDLAGELSDLDSGKVDKEGYESDVYGYVLTINGRGEVEPAVKHLGDVTKINDLTGDVVLHGLNIRRSTDTTSAYLTDELDNRVVLDQGTLYEGSHLIVGTDGIVAATAFVPSEVTSSSATGEFADAKSTYELIYNLIDVAVKYKGLVATDTDLPTTGQDNGDLWEISTYGNPPSTAHAIWNAANSVWDIHADSVSFPVSSVNTKTGAVVLTADDIKMLGSSTSINKTIVNLNTTLTNSLILKVDKYQGTSKAGMLLGIGTDGYVAPVGGTFFGSQAEWDALTTDEKKAYAAAAIDGPVNPKDMEVVPSTLTEVINAVYPVGSFYCSAAASMPVSIASVGTWVAVEGKVLVGKSATGTFSTLGATVGNETHTLTVAQMPAHTHSISVNNNNNVAGWASSWSNNSNTDHNTTSSGSGQAHNNIQPSLVVNMWQRTA